MKRELKYLLLSFILMFSGYTRLEAQPCLPNGITFSSQEEIDKFPVDYPNCTVIGGDVEINGDDIKNLFGLSALEKISGELVIKSNDSLVSLSGLDNLNRVDARVYITSNWILSSVDGLQQLTSIGGEIYFEYNHSILDLYGLSNLDSVYGSFRFEGNSSIINFNGLETLSFIGGALEIWSNNSLENFDGFSNLSTINGGMAISGNPSLLDLSGFTSLKHLQNDLIIYPHESLQSLSGLDSLISVSGNVNIGSGYPGIPNLLDLTGLGGLEKVYGEFKVVSNHGLSDLSGLINLDSVLGNLYVFNNHSLISLHGLDNLNYIGGDLIISDNDQLTDCSVGGICNYLSLPNGSIIIKDNNDGCSKVHHVFELCGLPVQCLPYGDYYFFNQADIDSFNYIYPNCTNLGGNVIIQGEEIYNLNGLTQVKSVGGRLYVGGNNQLTDLFGLIGLDSIYGNLNIGYSNNLTNLEGLNNLSFIGGMLGIGTNDNIKNLEGLENVNYVGDGIGINYNDSLSSLKGLNELDSIAGDFYLTNNPSLSTLEDLGNLKSIGGGLEIRESSELESLEGLEQLTRINGYLKIENTNLLTLSGLDNIEAGTIQQLYINGNSYLSHCAIKSICDYIFDPSGYIDIMKNAWGCMHPFEVEQACKLVSIDEYNSLSEVSVSPNPFTSSASIDYELKELSTVTCVVYNVLGEVVYQDNLRIIPPGKHSIALSLNHLAKGMYFLSLRTEDELIVIKMIKR